MNRKVKKVIGCALVGTLLMGALQGCGEKKKAAEKENITLKWIMAGQGMQQDSDKVWTEFNAKLQEYMPGVTVEIEPITFVDFAEKWQLFCSAGESADLVWTGYAVNFVDQISKGAYMPMDQLLADYAPDLKKEIPDWAWNLTKHDNQIYAMPIMQQYVSRGGIMTPKALSDQYMDKEKVVETNKDGGFTSQEGFDAVSEYLENLKKNGKLGKGVYASYIAAYANTTNDGAFYDSAATGVFCKQNEDGSFKTINSYDMPNVKLMYKNLAQWYKNGYIMPDILTMKDVNSYVGAEDGIVLTTVQVLEGEQERKSEQYGMEVDLTLLGSEKYRINASGCKTGIAIPKTAEHPKEAIELLQLLNTEKGKELYNLLTYGIEGEHYEFVGDNRIKTFDYAGSAPKSNSKYGIDKWAVGNTYYSYETTDVPEGWNTYIKDINSKAEVSPIIGFSLDTEPIKLELAQIAAIQSQYGPVLSNGVKGDDWESYFNEFVEKLKLAGQEKVRAEVDKQLNEWAKNNSK